MKCKFRWIVCMICFVSTTLTYGQNIRNRLFIGVNGAPQMALILNQNNYGHPELAYRPKIGYQIGPKVGFEWNNYNQIELGANWTTLGQSYEESIQNVLNEKVVELKYVYFPILYKRVFGYIDQWSDNTGSGNFYGVVGFQPGILLGANVEWYKNGTELGMFDYLLNEVENPNDVELRGMGAPQAYDELFQKIDFMMLLSLGYQYWISSFTSVSIEFKNGLGLSDINREAWRLPNRQKIYEPSRNAFTALNVSAQIYF